MIGYGSEHPNGRSYKIYLTRIRHIIMSMQQHVKQTHILVEGYLCHELKKNILHVSKRFNELPDTCHIIQQYETSETAQNENQVCNKWIVGEPDQWTYKDKQKTVDDTSNAPQKQKPWK